MCSLQLCTRRADDADEQAAGAELLATIMMLLMMIMTVKVIKKMMITMVLIMLMTKTVVMLIVITDNGDDDDDVTLLLAYCFQDQSQLCNFFRGYHYPCSKHEPNMGYLLLRLLIPRPYTVITRSAEIWESRYIETPDRSEALAPKRSCTWCRHALQDPILYIHENSGQVTGNGGPA